MGYGRWGPLYSWLGCLACVCRLHAAAVRSAALVSDEKCIRGVRRTRRCAIQIDNLYLYRCWTSESTRCNNANDDNKYSKDDDDDDCSIALSTTNFHLHNKCIGKCTNTSVSARCNLVASGAGIKRNKSAHPVWLLLLLWQAHHQCPYRGGKDALKRWENPPGSKSPKRHLWTQPSPKQCWHFAAHFGQKRSKNVTTGI